MRQFAVLPKRTKYTVRYRIKIRSLIVTCLVRIFSQTGREQATSFLREYNRRSIHNLTVHEAMPGHFVQLAHANQNPNDLRAVCGSGTFIEGWACYTEQMLSEEGFLDGDPLMRLVTLKWYLRTIANALLDQRIHVDGIRRADAMRMMIEDTFQEEREAAGKWTRAQLTSAQLSTYFVGYQEHPTNRGCSVLDASIM